MNAKIDKLSTILKELEEEDRLIQESRGEYQPDFYVTQHNRQKRFIQALTLVNDILGTFMGAFNAYEIRQLKLRFNTLSENHNMLVRVTSQHDQDIKELAHNMGSIMNLIDLMAEYNPSLLVM